MKIVVNNEQEADLMRCFFQDGHEYSVMDLIKSEKEKQEDTEDLQ
ncbi:hypothetical protein [Paenibacillus sp. S25]|nr:hypothetical protein [Paenibacillus sp. S25]QYK62547.1 hypothetical protein KAI37_02877 [Paenibacillus sp. S25]